MAAERGHYPCFSKFHLEPVRAVQAVQIAMEHGHKAMAGQIMTESVINVANGFADVCIDLEAAAGPGSPEALQAARWFKLTLEAAPGANPGGFYGYAIGQRAVKCVQVLIDVGAVGIPFDLLEAAEYNSQDVLDVVLPNIHLFGWSPKLAGQAAGAGHGHLAPLKRIFRAGCPFWTSAVDGEPWPAHVVGLYVPPGQLYPTALPDHAMIASSNVERSGPILLYAAAMGVNITPRMHVVSTHHMVSISRTIWFQC